MVKAMAATANGDARGGVAASGIAIAAAAGGHGLNISKTLVAAASSASPWQQQQQEQVSDVDGSIRSTTGWWVIRRAWP
jgi:hypothetical protein